MKISEEKYLKRTMVQVRKYTKLHPLAPMFYENLEKLNNKSLQDLSFQGDLNFFSEVNFICSVIISIIAHPHISNKGEDIIIRADQASSISSDMFLKTLKDSRLWRKKHGEMNPEEVYFYQNVDEFKIYENIFICMLIDMLDNETNKYFDFYGSLILQYDGNVNLSMPKDHIEIAFDQLNIINKKIKKIKNTYFYKEVSKNKTILNNIYPTNILLKDRLYNYCFKFYKKFITYNDKASLINDFTSYYYVLMLKSFYKNNMKLSLKNKDEEMSYDRRGNLNTLNKLIFSNKDFNVMIEKDDIYEGIKVIIENRNIKDENLKQATYLLLFDPQTNFSNAEKIVKEIENNLYLSIEAISLWNIKDYSINNDINNYSLKEEELIDSFFKNKMIIANGSKKLYSHFCPACKNKTVEEENNEYKCYTCNSHYVFYDNADNQNVLWFKKLRRS